MTAEDAVSRVGKAVFLDARAGPEARQAFAQAHLSGAVHVDLEADLSAVGDPARGGRHPLPPLHTWLARLGAWGVSPSAPVIVYDDAGGGMAAARAWWMLHVVGHEPLFVVDGGWAALLRAGAPTERGEARPMATGVYPRAIDDWPTVDAALVERVRTDPSWRLIDARAPERYTGLSEPLDPVPGHIPGAINLYWRTQLDRHERFLSEQALRKRYDGILQDVPPDQVVCYCGSGVTACHLLLAMEACGLEGAKLYVGSWSEWCRRKREGVPA